jgi:hypothetical protein
VGIRVNTGRNPDLGAWRSFTCGRLNTLARGLLGEPIIRVVTKGRHVVHASRLR